MSVFDTDLPWLASANDPYRSGANRILKQYDIYAIHDLYLGYAEQIVNESTNTITVDPVEAIDPFLVMRYSPNQQPQVDLLSEAITRSDCIDRYLEKQYLVTANVEQTITSADEEHTLLAFVPYGFASWIFSGNAMNDPGYASEFQLWQTGESLFDYLNGNYQGDATSFDLQGLYYGGSATTKGLRQGQTLLNPNQQQIQQAKSDWYSNNGYPKQLYDYFKNDGSLFDFYPSFLVERRVFNVTSTTITVIDPLI